MESFSLQKEIARSVIHQAIQYIVSALNSALMQNVDYHLPSIRDTYFDVKWVGESVTRVSVNKFQTT